MRDLTAEQIAAVSGGLTQEAGYAACDRLPGAKIGPGAIPGFIQSLCYKGVEAVTKGTSRTNEAVDKATGPSGPASGASGPSSGASGAISAGSSSGGAGGIWIQQNASDFHGF